MGEPALRGEREGRPGAGLASVLREPGTKSLGGVGVLTQKVLVQVEGEPRGPGLPLQASHILACLVPSMLAHQRGAKGGCQPVSLLAPQTHGQAA